MPRLSMAFFHAPLTHVQVAASMSRCLPACSRMRCSNQAGIKSAMLGKAGENAKLKFNAVVQTVRGVTV